MPEKIRYVKYVKKSKNVLEEYVVGKYGSINNFLSRLEKFNDTNYERKNLENAIKDSGFLETMQLGMRVCGGLKIDFVELFGNENIRASDSANDFNTEESAEEKYSLLNLDARRKTLEYINNILKTGG